MIEHYEIPLALEGADGEAAASAIIGLPVSELSAVVVDYADQPATTDLTVTNQGRAVLTLTDGNDDGVYYPSEAADDGSGADIAAEYRTPLIFGDLSIAAEDGDAGPLTVTLITRR